MRVLYLTDGRPPAISAAEVLAAIADPGGIGITVLYVDEYGNKLVADRIAEQVLGQGAEYLGDAGFTVAVKRSGGGVKRAVERELVTGGHELVAMGAGNTGWLGRLILGGVSTFVLHRSAVPTLVVHRAPTGGRDRVRVVVGTDGSPAASRAVDALIALVRPERSDIFVRSVVELRLPTPPGVPDPDLLQRGGIEGIVAEQTEAADRSVRDTLARLSEAGFSCDGDVVRGSAEVSLLEAVQEREADLVVVGTRGRGRVAAALGSVSGHLVRTAPAALVAPDPDASRPGRSAGPEAG